MNQERHIVIALDPRTGTHRVAGVLLVKGEDTARFTVPAVCIAAVAQHLRPEPHEYIVSLGVKFDEAVAPPPKPTLRSV